MRIFVVGTEQIVPTAPGFEVHNEAGHCWSLEWDKITGVYAFKEDAATIDVICFAFQLGDRTNALWCIHEDMPGYKDIEDGISRLSEGAWPAKFREVAAPAFEYNWTVIWRSPGTPPVDEDAHLLRWFVIPDDLRRELQLETDE